MSQPESVQCRCKDTLNPPSYHDCAEMQDWIVVEDEEHASVERPTPVPRVAHEKNEGHVAPERLMLTEAPAAAIGVPFPVARSLSVPARKRPKNVSASPASALVAPASALVAPAPVTVAPAPVARPSVGQQTVTEQPHAKSEGEEVGCSDNEACCCCCFCCVCIPGIVLAVSCII